MAEGDSAAADRLAREHLPEYALPYCVHLLAHLAPELAPSSDEEELVCDAATRKALLLLLEALVASLGDAADNVAFVLRCCQEMGACDDAEVDDARTAACRAVLFKNTHGPRTRFYAAVSFS